MVLRFLSGWRVWASPRLTPLPYPLPKVEKGTQQIRICFVIDKLSRAGTESQLLALIRNLDRERVEPTLCLLNADEGSRTLLPIDCPVLNLQLKKIASLSALSAAIRLRAFWREHRVNIVQTYFLDSTYFAMPLARLCGIRNVIRVRNNAGYWLTPMHRRLGNLMGRLGQTLTNSEQARGAVILAERIGRKHVQVIENGVDLERFPINRPPETDRAVVRIGMVANLRTVKNVDGLIRVAVRIVQEFPRVQFAVAGEGEERANLERQIRSQIGNLTARFELLGSVIDVPRFLADLDIAVNCSHSESMSNAVLEYMAAGRAVVVTEVGANARLVRHEREGLIVPASNDDALFSAIRRLLLDSDLAKGLGNSARVRAEKEFSRQAMVRRFEMYYSSLVKRKSPLR